MPIAMYRRLIRKLIAQTYAAYCQARGQGQPLKGWWKARKRLDRLCQDQESTHDARRNP